MDSSTETGRIQSLVIVALGFANILLSAQTVPSELEHVSEVAESYQTWLKSWASDPVAPQGCCDDFASLLHGTAMDERHDKTRPRGSSSVAMR